MLTPIRIRHINKEVGVLRSIMRNNKTKRIEIILTQKMSSGCD